MEKQPVISVIQKGLDGRALGRTLEYPDGVAVDSVLITTNETEEKGEIKEIYCNSRELIGASCILHAIIDRDHAVCAIDVETDDRLEIIKWLVEDNEGPFAVTGLGFVLIDNEVEEVYVNFCRLPYDWQISAGEDRLVIEEILLMRSDTINSVRCMWSKEEEEKVGRTVESIRSFDATKSMSIFDLVLSEDGGVRGSN